MDDHLGNPDTRIVIVEALIESMDAAGLERVQTAVQNRWIALRQVKNDPSPRQPPGAGGTWHERERTPAVEPWVNAERDAFLKRSRLSTFRDECIENRWTLDNPAALARAEELGGPEFIALIPATLDEMDLAYVGQRRYMSGYASDVFHIVTWSGLSKHIAVCGTEIWPGKRQSGQSSPPSPEQGHVCKHCAAGVLISRKKR